MSKVMSKKAFKLPKPVKVLRTTFGKLSEGYRTAIENAPQDGMDIDDDDPVRVETYRTSDMVRLLERWEWSASLADLSEANDRKRVQKIMRLIPSAGQWPYVSYWADNMEELAEITIEGDEEAYEESEGDYEVSVPNHGDGWHRIVAMAELGLPTVDVVFIEP